MSEVRAVEAFLKKGRGLIGLHRKIVYGQMSRDFVRAVRKGFGITRSEAEGTCGRAYKEMIVKVLQHGGGKVGQQFEEVMECFNKDRKIGVVVMLMSFEPGGIRTLMTVTPAENEEEQETDGDGFGMYEEGGGRK